MCWDDIIVSRVARCARAATTTAPLYRAGTDNILSSKLNYYLKSTYLPTLIVPTNIYFMYRPY